jgi:hypothetical protein
VEEETQVDDPAQDAVPAVEILVGGAEGESEGVETFGGEEVLDGEVGGAGGGEFSGEEEVICEGSVISVLAKRNQVWDRRYHFQSR